MKKYLLAGLIALALPLAYGANAQTATNFYQSSQPVASASQADWQAAVKQALQQVLVNISGNPRIIALPAVRSALQNPAQLVESYNYITAAAGQQTLQIMFNPLAIKQLLHNTNQVVINQNRQPVLLWIELQTKIDQSVLHSPSNPLVTTMQNAARAQNIPLLWPLMDLQDVDALPMTKLANLDVTAIQAASQRYAVTALLAGKIAQTAADQWQAHWLFSDNGQTVNWTTSGETPADAMVAVIANLANQTKPAPMTVNNVQKTALLLNISGVNGLDDYADVMKYLRALGPVTNIATVQVGNGQLLLQVTAAGGAAALTQALNLSQQLVPAPANTVPIGVDTTANAAATKFYYHWQSVAPAVPSATVSPTIAPAVENANSNTDQVVTYPADNNNADSDDASSANAPIVVNP